MSRAWRSGEPLWIGESGVAVAGGEAPCPDEAARLRRRIEGFPRLARSWLAAGAALALWVFGSAPSLVGVALAIWSVIALLRVPQRRLLVEQWLVVAASVGMARGAIVGGGVGIVGLALLQWVVLRVRPEVGTQRLVGFDLCQILLTTPTRVSTTHHFLELEEPLERARLVGALRLLIRDVARLRSFVREAPLGIERFVAPRLWVDAGELIDWHESAVEPEEIGWFERRIDLTNSPAVRLFHAPRAGGGYRFGLTLHHSIADGTGAMALLDGLLRRYDRLRGMDVALPPILSDGPRYRRVAWGHGIGAIARTIVAAMRTPRGVWSASLADDETPRPAKFAHRVLDLPADLWRATTAAARAQGCTPNQILIAASVRAAAEVRAARGRPSGTFRLLVPSDMRTLFGLPRSLPNYIGTVPLEIAADEVGSPSLPRLVAERLGAGRAIEVQLKVPLQMGFLGLLPPVIGRGFLHRFDQDPNTFAYSYLFSHIRVPADLHLPAGAVVERLWCASAQGRQPAFGVVVTTIGERTWALLQYLEPYVAHEAARAFEGALLARLRELVVDGGAACASG